MNKALALLTISLLALGIFGCTSAPVQNRSKDFPLTVLNSMFVPGILQSTGVDQASGGNAFLALKVRMENKGGSSASVVASGFSVVIDSERYRCDFLKDTDNDPRFDGQDIGSVTISPKSYVEGWMIFEVPVSVKGINNGELRFTDKALLGDGAYSKVTFAPSGAKRYDAISARFTIEARSMIITYKYAGAD